jgi:hypothetical protein
MICKFIYWILKIIIFEVDKINGMVKLGAGRKITDMTGKKFYNLTAIRFIKLIERNYRPMTHDAEWLWKCDCGNEVSLLARNVKRGQNKSCGCHVNRGWKTVARHVYNKYRDGNLTFEQFIHLTQQPCHYCERLKNNKRTMITTKKNYWEYNGLDRLDSTKPHDLDNVVSCCWNPCNNKKSDTEYNEFLDWIEKVYHTRCKNRIGVKNETIKSS